MRCRQATRRHYQAAVRGARERREATLDLIGVVKVDQAHVYSDGGSHRLNNRELTDTGRYSGVPQHRNARHARRNLLKQFQPFRAQAVFEQGKTGSVAARSRQTVHEPGAHGIADIHEHDRHCAGDLQ